MTGFQTKKRMAESRFAMITEDPDYDEDMEWEDAEGWQDLVDVPEYDPFNTMNS